MNTKTIVVGMSGGVDSSVTAALLQEEGYDVIGVTMKTYDFDEVGGNVANEASCCGLGAVHDARLVAAKLDIPHYVVDFREAFGKAVIENFVSEYIRGRTPNPCVICNREIKWGELLRKAEALGARYVATGHYARLRFDDARGRCVISKARSTQKDQSYALWGVSQEGLRKTMFPLGEKTKPEVRALAEKYGLRTAAKEESYDICFVPDNDYSRFLKEQDPAMTTELAQGEVVWDGKVVGTHRGYPFYTVGQRKGVGAFGQRVYVTGIESKSNIVHIGPESELYRRGLLATDVLWSGIGRLDLPLRVQGKVRYKDDATPATVYPETEGRIRVVFDEPKRAITPGQSVVLYEGEDLLGGGVIQEAID